MTTPSPASVTTFDTCARIARGRWAIWTLLALSLLMFVPGIASLPTTDRDEARYAQASRQMAESGDYVHIRFQDEPRNKKPAGAYWLQATAAQITDQVGSGAIWPFRLPSLIGATLAVLLLFAFARPAFGPSAAFLAAGLLGASVLAASEARLAKTDALLLATAVAAQVSLVRIYLARARTETPSKGLAVAFWIAQGLAILVKGPVIPFVSLMTVLGLAVSDRKTRWLGALKALWGIPLALLIAAPWFIAITVTDSGFIQQSVGQDLLPKLFGIAEQHGGWPGTYLLLSPLTFWPGSLLLVPALMIAWRERTRPEVRALLAWLIPAWIVFEAIPTKLPHYVLPLYPALALLVARAAVAPMGSEGIPDIVGILGRISGKIWLGIWIVVSLVLAALGIVATVSLHAPAALIPAIALCAATLALTVGALVLARRGQTAGALGLAVALAIPFHALLFAGVAPRLDTIWLSRDAAAAVAAHAPAGSTVATAGYSEPSVVFALGTNTILGGAKTAAAALADGRASLALVEDREGPTFYVEAQRLGLNLRALATIEGVNYSRGQKTVLRLYAKN